MSTSPPTANKRKAARELTHPSGPDLPPTKKTSSARPQKASLKGDVPPLGKFLASNDKATRDRAVAALRKFLSGQGGSGQDIFQNGLFETQQLPHDRWEKLAPKHLRLEESELAKLYKGLFYCYWMSDKPLVQQHLAQELADLCLIIRPAQASGDPLLDQVSTTQTALAFWKQFWCALGCEWQGVDKHRLDKYLLLMRRFVQVAFTILQRAHWHPNAIELWSDSLKQTVLKYDRFFSFSASGPAGGVSPAETDICRSVADSKTPLSITYHVADIFLEELDRVLEKRPERPAPIVPLLAPLIHALSQSRPGTATFRKIIENVFEPLLANLDLFASGTTQPAKSSPAAIYPSFETSLLSSSPSNQAAGPASRTDFQAIRTGLLALLFQAGSDPLCLDPNRKKIYNYWYSKRGVDDAEEEADPAEEGK